MTKENELLEAAIDVVAHCSTQSLASTTVPSVYIERLAEAVKVAADNQLAEENDSE